jgi:hypothetical protein
MTTSLIPSRRWTADELASGARYALITDEAAEDAMMSWAAYGGWIAVDAPIMGQTVSPVITALRGDFPRDDEMQDDAMTAYRDSVADYLLTHCAMCDRIRYLAAVPAAVASAPGLVVSVDIVDIIAALGVAS